MCMTNFNSSVIGDFESVLQTKHMSNATGETNMIESWSPTEKKTTQPKLPGPSEDLSSRCGQE